MCTCIPFSFPVSPFHCSNLYATEYKKSHPRVTTGEYRIVWDTLDETTRKVLIFFSSFFVWITELFLQEFEQLCKAKKAERKAGKALIAGDVTEP